MGQCCHFQFSCGYFCTVLFYGNTDRMAIWIRMEFMDRLTYDRQFICNGCIQRQDTGTSESCVASPYARYQATGHHRPTDAKFNAGCAGAGLYPHCLCKRSVAHKVIFGHALRNAINPVITAITGWFAELLAGAFFIEYIFGWQGIGKITVDALEKLDYPVVMGSVLVTAFLFVVVNILADLLYSIVDPRIGLK